MRQILPQVKPVRFLLIFAHRFTTLPFLSLPEVQQLLLSTLPDAKPTKANGNGYINFAGLWSRS